MNASLTKSTVVSLNPLEPVFLETNASVADAIKCMRDHKAGCVLVSDSKNLVGMLTERDILLKLGSEVRDLHDVPVADLMSKDPTFLFEDDSAAFALNEMSVGGHRNIAVIDKNRKPCGILTIEHILDHIIDKMHF